MKRINFTKISLLITIGAFIGLLIVTLLIIKLIVSEDPDSKPEIVVNDPDTIIDNNDNQPNNQENIIDSVSIEPEQNSRFGVPGTSDYILTITGKALTLEEVKAALTVSPLYNYTISEENTFYRIHFDETLEPGSVILFTFEESVNTWAYQIMDTFSVKSVYYDKNQIKITFSKQVPEDIEDYLTFIPYVDGQITIEENVVIFEPSLGFLSNQTYEMVIGALYGYENDHLEQEYRKRFTIEAYDTTNHKIQYPSDEQIVASSDKAKLGFELLDQDLINQEVSMEVFKLSSVVDYLDALKKYAYGYGYVMENLNFDDHWVNWVTIQGTGVNNDAFVSLESLSGDGYYCSVITIEDIKYIQFFQITPYQAFGLEADGELIVYVLDTKTGQPAENLYLYVNGDPYGVTDTDGICNTSLMVQALENITLVDENGHSYAVPMASVDNSSFSEIKTRFFADQTDYKVGEWVKLMGQIEDEGIESVYLKIHTQGNNTNEVIEIRLNDSGAFLYQYPLEEGCLGQVEAELYVNGEMTDRITYGVNQCQNQEGLVLTTDRQVIKSQEVLTLYAQLDAIDGSFSDKEVVFEYDGQKMKAMTDEYGVATVSVVPSIKDDIQSPKYMPITASFYDNEGHYAYDATQVLYYPRDRTISGALVSRDRILIGTIANIDTSSLNPYSKMTTAAPSEAVRLEIYRQEIDESFIGYVENNILESPEELYNYETSWILMDIRKTETDSDGNYQIELPLLESDETYKLVVSAVDSKDKKICETFYLNNGDGVYRSIMNNKSALEVSFDKAMYGQGDTIRMQLSYNHIPIKDTEENEALYIILKEGVYTYFHEEDLIAEMTMDQEVLLGAGVKALYYDGYQLIETDTFLLPIETTTYELDVDVNIDKEIYGEKESVTAQVTLKDYKGDYVIGDLFLTVKESELERTYTAISQEVLNNGYYGVLDTGLGHIGLSSYYSDLFDTDKEHINKNMGNGLYSLSRGSVLEQYEGKTNGLGVYNFVFDLPSDIDMFSIEAVAVTPSGQIGTDTVYGYIEDTFKLDVLQKDTYQRDEHVTMQVTTHLKDYERVLYDIAVVDLLSEETMFSGVYENDGFLLSGISIGILPEGEYKILVTASNSNSVDSVEKTIKVVSQETYVDRIEPIDINAMPEEVVPDFLYVMDASYSNCFMAFYELYQNYSSEDGVSQLLAELSADIMNRQFQTYFESPAKSVHYTTMNSELLDTLLLVAWMDPSLIKESYGKQLVSDIYGYIYSVEADSEEYFKGLTLLAMLDEPVLLELKKGVTSSAGVSSGLTMSKIYIVMGLLEMGDIREAQELYDHLKSQYAILSQKSYYLKNSDDFMEAWMLGIAVKLMEADSSYWYRGLSLNEDNDITCMNRYLYLMNQEGSEGYSFEIIDSEATYSLEVEEGTGYRLTVSNYDYSQLYIQETETPLFVLGHYRELLKEEQ